MTYLFIELATLGVLLSLAEVVLDLVDLFPPLGVQGVVLFDHELFSLFLDLVLTFEKLDEPLFHDSFKAKTNINDF